MRLVPIAPRLLLGLLALAPGAARAQEAPANLPGTRPLTAEGDLAAQLVEGVDRFLLRQTGRSVTGRARHWNRDLSSAQAYEASIRPNRERLAHILGVRDARPKDGAIERVGTTERDPIIGRSGAVTIATVRWPAFGDVAGEGLLLTPVDRPTLAHVIVVPDADQTPEQLAGLIEGLPPERQVARRLAESGCRVIVPTLVDRTVAARNGRTKLTSREFLQRPAFELGRTVPGYEVNLVLALVDRLAAGSAGADAAIGVVGLGEGGLIALDAAALDPRIDATLVSGAFDGRLDTWREPLERNVFGLLDQFGGAELASLVAPRPLVIEATAWPEVTIPTGTGAAPGRLATPPLAAVQAEVERARTLTAGLKPEPRIDLIASGGDGAGPRGSEPALAAFLKALNPPLLLVELSMGPQPSGVDREAIAAEAAARQARLVHALDRHTQHLLLESPYVRAEFLKKLDTKSPEAYAQTVEEYRRIFRDEVIGRIDEPMLPPAPRSRKLFETDKLVGYEVMLDVWPDVPAFGTLVVPKDLKPGEKRPVVVCQHGLEGRPRDLADPTINNPAYNQYALRLAERGFVTFSPQNLYIGEDRFRTLQRKANPLGKTLFSIIVPQHQQITDWLKTLPFVDPNRIAFYGLSYGGKSAMRIPPLVANYCLSICSADFNEWVGKNASTRSPYSYVWTNEYEIFEWDLGTTFNYAEMAALIAPRPFMVERGHFDGVGSDQDVAYEFAKVRHLYAARLKLPPEACQIEWFVGPHTIHGVGTFEFLHRHLNWPMTSPPQPLNRP